jgi:hypothetical protein
MGFRSAVSVASQEACRCIKSLIFALCRFFGAVD